MKVLIVDLVTTKISDDSALSSINGYGGGGGRENHKEHKGNYLILKGEMAKKEECQEQCSEDIGFTSKIHRFRETGFSSKTRQVREIGFS